MSNYRRKVFALAAAAACSHWRGGSPAAGARWRSERVASTNRPEPRLRAQRVFAGAASRHSCARQRTAMSRMKASPNRQYSDAVSG